MHVYGQMMRPMDPDSVLPEDAARIAVLRRMAILDSAREAAFDEVAELASRICETPVSLVSLVDTDRQWFKAEIGLGLSETSRDVSICSQAIREGDFLELPDTLADERTSSNPLCIGDNGLRFYAGAVLRTSDDIAIGTLCVLDRKPRELTEIQRDTLRVLARQVVTQLELRETIEREKTLRQEIDHRVKNSLQSVGSFVALERRCARDEAAADVLASVQQQIQTVAMLHEHIGVGTGEGEIGLADYLGRVMRLFGKASGSGLAIDGTFDDLRVNAKVAGTLAMIVNELAANAVKHSFGDLCGSVEFTGELRGERTYRLTCMSTGSRNGVTGDAASRRIGLGLSIIKASVQQLGGTFETDASNDHYRTVIEAHL